jgi:hypothetical protein
MRLPPSTSTKLNLNTLRANRNSTPPPALLVSPLWEQLRDTRPHHLSS